MGSSPLVTLVIVTVACGVAGVALSRTRARRWRLGQPWAALVEVGFLVGVAAWGLLEGRGILAMTPGWSPVGQDFHEFLTYTLYFLQPDLVLEPSWYRYPLYPGLAASLSVWLDTTPATSAMWLSAGASMRLPLCGYAVGRSLAPAPLAAAGALLVLRYHPLTATVGDVTDYALLTALQCLCLAAAIAAVRGGGWPRMLALGVALALMMASTSRALMVVLPAVSFAGARAAYSLLVGAPLRPHRGALALVALLAPLAWCWGWFADAPMRFHTLEHAVYVVQVDDAKIHGASGRHESLPYWHTGGSPGANGHWVVGEDEPLRRAWAAARLLGELRPLVPTAVRRAAADEGLRDALHLGHLGWLALLALACLGAGLPDRYRGFRVVPYLSTVGVALALVGLPLWGLLELVYRDRYALAVVAQAGVLLVTGAAQPFLLAMGRAQRGMLLPWLPVLGAALLLLGPVPGPMGRAQFTAELLEVQRRSDPSPEAALAAELHTAEGWPTSGDQVVDLSDHLLASPILWRPGLDVHWVPVRVRFGERPVVPPTPGGRRFVVLPADRELHTAFHARLRERFDEPGRFVSRGAHVVEDLQPAEPLDLRRAAARGGTAGAP